MGQTGPFLRKICCFLRKSALPKCCNSQESENLQKSVKICEKKTANSARFVPFSFLLIPLDFWPAKKKVSETASAQTWKPGKGGGGVISGRGVKILNFQGPLKFKLTPFYLQFGDQSPSL